MKIALVHDYLKDFGGAERVLEALCEIWPDAPIYTAFFKEESEAYQRFRHRKIIPSWVHSIPFFAEKLHSPLRFLAPLIWGSFDFSKYDVVISSASWYVTKGFGRRRTENRRQTADNGKAEKKFSVNSVSSTIRSPSSVLRPLEICYCHTPPRWLYGYKTSVEWQKYWPIKVYSAIVGHFMRLYDFSQAQKVDYFIANSKETAGRIKKFYRREAEVIYPPVTIAQSRKRAIAQRESYYFMVSRIVGGKGIELGIETAFRLKIKLKIAGAKAGFYSLDPTLAKKAEGFVEFLGPVTDEQLVELYSGAKAFLALATDEDFGITPVEAMLCGTPVIAYYGGGYKETVLQGRTGVFFHEPTVESLSSAIKQLNNLTISSKDCITQAEKFSKERFMKEIKEFVEKALSL